MKLSGPAGAAFARKPDPRIAAVLIAGGDPGRVADRRQETLAAILGPDGEAEMRLTRIAAADLRKDPALLSDAVRARGFFSGPRAVHLEDCSDGLTDLVAAVLDDWREGDARIVATAGALTARSPLRRLFESHRLGAAMILYDDPPGAEEIAAMLAAAGLQRIDPEARAAIADLAQAMEPGDLRRLIEKLGLYMLGSTAPVTAADVAACAPLSTEADLDDLCEIVGDRREDAIAGTLRRLYAQGVSPTGILIGLLRHLRGLHMLVSHPGGPGAAVTMLRPPVGGRRRDALLRQAGRWTMDQVEAAIAELLDTDLQLRSASRAPDRALAERCLIRVVRLRGRA
jgi:DNA polymerase-3 subunit delta